LMGTLFSVTCHHPDAALVEKAVAAAFAEAEAINACASDYIADSELLSLSKQPVGTPVVVSPRLFKLVNEARDLAEKTHGAFDPTLGPLTKLWRESRRRKALPDPESLAAAKAASGWQHLILDPEKSTATFNVPDMRLDLGGIAKGQAADAMLAVLKSHGISSASVTAGGDVRVGDPPPDAKGWQVGVRTFDKEKDATTLFLSNGAVSTSGSLQQTIEIDGVHYAHIIDPSTGLGLTKPVAATVLAPTSATSDALATACCILPREEASKLCRSLKARLL
ncbi:MAG TPA: FAD:protein FMN transferase, partial [Luteolibacter sp.]|nr:FAD:protein FMN transferase [Luteolibacter sp.]